MSNATRNALPIALSLGLGLIAVVLAFVSWRGSAAIPAIRDELETLRRDVHRSRLEETMAMAEQIERLETAIRAIETRETERARAAGSQAERDARALASAAQADASLATEESESAAILDDESRAEEERVAEIETELDRLLDPSTSRDRTGRALSRLRELGAIDQAIEHLEAAVAERPDDPDTRVDLGDAYIQKLFKAGFIEQGRLSMKANASYDAALAIDETHWDARFSKAVNWSFAPAALGFQEKAIAELETLRAQQEGAPREERFAQTYLLLGNLHAARGHLEKAAEARRQAAELYPEARSWLDNDANAGSAGSAGSAGGEPR